MRYGDVPDPSLWVEVDITEIQRLRRKEERRQALEALGPDAVAKATADREKRRMKRIKLHKQREKLELQVIIHRSTYSLVAPGQDVLSTNRFIHLINTPYQPTLCPYPLIALFQCTLSMHSLPTLSSLLSVHAGT